jgi:hypothetical protein
MTTEPTTKIDIEYLSDMFSKPMIAGTCAYLATRFVTYGVNSSGKPFAMNIESSIPGINYFNGNRLSLGVATGLFVMLGSLSGNVITHEVYPYIHKKEKFKNLGAGMVLLSTVCGTTLLTHYAANPKAVNDRGMINIIAMAAACESVANVTYDNVVRPMILGKENSADYDYYDDDFSLGYFRDSL